MFLTHALRAIYRAAVTTGDTLWKYVSLLISGTPPAVTFISDASTGGNVLTLNGDTRPSNFNPYTPGYYSNYFDGTGDFLTTSSATFSTTGDLTLECWAYVTSASNYAGLASMRDSTSGNGISLTILNTGYLEWSFGQAAGNFYQSTLCPLNQWFHIALVRSGSSTNNCSCYLNGTRVAQFTSNLEANGAANTFIIGRYYASGTSQYFLNGYVSNLRYVKGTALYSGTTYTVPTAPLTAIANTSLLTCQSNRLIDNSVNNFAITKNGDTTVSGFTPFTPPTSVNVNTLYSTYFDGTGDYLSVPASTAMVLSGDFTIECWVYTSTLSGNQGIIASSAQRFGLIRLTNYFYWLGSTDLSGSSITISANTWYHVAVSRSGTTLRLFVNGVQANSGTYSEASTSNIWYIGSNQSNEQWNGYISNVRVVKGTAVYTANFTPPTAPLTAITNTALLTCQNATLIDNSTNAFAITSAGDARPIAQSPFTQTTTAVTTTYLGSGYFDGTGDYLSGSVSISIGSSDFCIEAWGYWTSFNNGTYGSPVIALGRASPAAQITLRANKTAAASTSANYFSTDNGVYIPSAGYTSGVTAGTIYLNQWTHIALTRQGSTFRMFINGVLVSTQTDATAFGTAFTTVNIGSDKVPSDGYMTGWVTDARVVVGSAIYTASFDPPTQPLTAVTNTKLLTLQTDQPAANKQFVDNSGSNLLITQAGNTTQGTFSPYGANWSTYFDGTGDYLITPSLGSITGNFTIEYWYYAVVPTNTWYPYVFGSNTPWQATGGIGMSYTTQTTVADATAFDLTVAGTAVTVSTFGAIKNKWNHIAVVRSGSTITAYLNGVASGTITNSATIATTTFYIGGTNEGGSYDNHAIKGSISNFRIVNGTAVYTAAFTPPTAPLTAISGTSLLTCQSSRFVDNSSNAFTITVNGDTSVQRFSPFSPVIQTPTTYSTYFDGTGDYLTATGSAAFTLGTGDFTIECWFYTAVGTNNAMFQLSNTAGGFNTTYTNTIAIGLLAGKINLYGVAGTGITSTGSSYATSTWTHVALVRSSGVTKLYINGVLDTTVGTAGSITDTTSYTMQYVVVGGYYSTAYLWNGYVSNLRVVKGTAVYTAAFTPPTAPLTAISGTSLLTCQSATHIDNSSNAFTLTQNGDAIPRRFNPFGFTQTTTGTAYTPALYGGSAYFDGTGDYITAPTNAAAFSFATGDFTAEMQLYPTAFASYKSLWGCSSGAASSTGFHTGLNASGNVFIYSASAFKVTTTNAMNLNAWNHVAFVRSGTALNIYINGVLGGTWTLTTQTFTDSAGWFGAAPGLASEYYTGYLNDFKITKGTALYKGSFVPPLAPVTATAGATLLLNMDKGAAIDSSRSNDLETVGDAKIVKKSPYTGNYSSMYFDGTGDYLVSPSYAANSLGTDFTVEAWVFPTVASATYGLAIAGTYDGGTNSGWSVVVNRSTGGTLGVAFIHANALQSTYGTYLTANTWTHVAVSRSGSSLKLFVNGAVVTTTTYATADSIIAPLYVGSQGTTSALFNGYIADLRITKFARYTAAFTPPTAPLPTS